MLTELFQCLVLFALSESCSPNFKGSVGKPEISLFVGHITKLYALADNTRRRLVPFYFH